MKIQHLSTRILPFAALIFFLFPYTKIIPSSSYTQPYGLLLALVIVVLRPQAITNLPQIDRVMLSFLAMIGVAMVLFQLPLGLQPRELAYLISYITPLVTTAAAFWMLRLYPDMVRKLLIAAAVIWFVVSIIQLFISPTFLTSFVSNDPNLAQDIRASGRGTLGLAPEPTHNAFHNLLIGASLVMVGGPAWAIGLCIASAFILAQSASAVLVIGLGLLLWAVRHPFLGWIIALPFIFPQFAIQTLSSLTNPQTRLGSIISRLKDLDPAVVLQDHSINFRLAGASMPILYSIEDFFLPQGVSIENWVEQRNRILAEQTWVIDLSTVGPASGFGLYLVQGGIIALPVILYFMYRLILIRQPHFASFVAIVVFTIFLGQFYLSTPIFGLFYAALIMRTRPSAPSDEASINLETMVKQR